MSRSDDRLLVDDSSFTNDYMSSLSKARRDIIEDCMIVLGYPVITLYITQYQIDKLIDFATRKCESKACMPHLALINVGNGVVDVSQYDVEAVRQIYEGNIGGSGGCAKLVADPDSDGGGGNLAMGPCDICDQLCRYRGYSMMDSPDGKKMLYDYIAYNMARSEMRNLILTDWYLDPTSNKLYIDGYGGLVTMEYVKAHSTFEEISREAYWRQWIRDYTIALVKITEGRIRSKYKISSGVFEIEADELISEGNNDKQELEQKLTDGDFGYWNIM